MSDAGRPLTVAVPKGRILKQLAPLLERAGIDPAPLFANDRRLIRPSARYTGVAPAAPIPAWEGER